MCDICHEFHESLEKSMGELTKEQKAMRRDLEVHIAEAHRDVVTVDSTLIRRMASDFEELATAVMGPKRTILEGGGRHEEEGLVAQMREVREWQRNGTMKLKLTGRDWAGIVIAIIGAVSAIIVGT